MKGKSRALAFVMASVVAVAPLSAQPRPPTEDQKTRVADLANKATAKSDKGDYDEAAALYLEAYKVYPLAPMLSNAAAQYQKAKKPVEALRYFCLYLEKDPAGIVASHATAQAKVLQTELGNKQVDDKNPCASKRADPVAPITAPAPATASAGPPGDIPRPATRPASNGRTLRTAGLVTGGVGLVGIGAGVLFGVKARSISNQISDHNPAEPWPDDIKQMEQDGEAFETKQVIFLIAGGVVTIAGTAMYLIGRSKRDESNRVTVTPVATPDSIGVSLTGGF
ncbi:MAG: hypothetical protein WKG01_34085 [Kofleriaceae bacterium]